QWTKLELQWVLLVAMAVVPIIAFVRRPQRDAPVRRQILTIAVPVLVLALFIINMWLRWTEVSGFLTPVGFLMGHGNAEDNAKWLDFTSQYATGSPIVQSVPMGGPLELFLVFVGTAMGAMSQAVLGGYNQVAVAANTVVFGEFVMVMIAPLALAPLAEAWFKRPIASRDGRPARIPWPLIWLGALVLVTANLIATAYGHLTFQFVVLVTALWITAYLADSKVPRARLLTSLIVAIAMTVWVPLNVLAVLLLVGWMATVFVRVARGGWRAADPVGIALLVVAVIGIWQPLRSSMAYLFSTAGQSASEVVGGGVHAVMAAVNVIPGLGFVRLGIDESSLFAAGGGTEQTGPILAVLVGAAVLAAALVASRQSTSRHEYVRLLAVGLLGLYAVAITVLDQWSTGGGPHYGAMKFTFLTCMVLLGTCVPVGILLVDPERGGMSLPRWTALAAVVFLLIIDSILPRSVAALRPQQWSPPHPFNNPGSYWWPAEVKDAGGQLIQGNPVGCVYLPQGAKVPSAVLTSELSPPQRVYSCTRILAGLSGQDTQAQPLVDWLRREWLNNKGAWAEVYDYLSGMPQSVKDKPMILLDDGSNVIGIETVQSLLDRYPKYAGKTPEELAQIQAGG
ncbi:MAG: hypothetical protein WCI74_11195, partial [Actinomycetes bacterium]